MFKHPDPLDNANEVVEHFTQKSIDNILKNSGYEKIPFKGVCYNCQDLLDKPHRFCDEYCLEDWEHRENAKKRNGG